MRDILTLLEHASSDNYIINTMVTSILNLKFWNVVAAKKYNLDDEVAYDMLMEFMHQLPEDMHEMEPDEIFKTQEFKSLVTIWATSRLKKVKEKINAISTKNGHYLLHRVIKTDPINLLSSKNVSLGVYWTYNINEWEARPIWGETNPGIELTIAAMVRPEQIDWTNTYLSGMDWHSGDEEYEIRVLPKSKLKVLSISSEHEKFDITGINFYA